MKSTVKAFQDLYVSFGGSLTDTYSDIAGGVPVGDYTVKPDVIEALAKITGGSIELPAVTSADNGKALIVSEGAWGAGNIPANGFLITITVDGSEFVVDKTYEQILNALRNGLCPVAKYVALHPSFDDVEYLYEFKGKNDSGIFFCCESIEPSSTGGTSQADVNSISSNYFIITDSGEITRAHRSVSIN